MEATPTAMAALTVPNPSRIMTVSESNRDGMDNSTSTKRIRKDSTRPANAPAITPRPVPTTSPIVTAASAALREWDAPYTIRV